MPDLIAQGPEPDQRWRRKLEPGVRQTIGRQAGVWSTPWDDRVSRRHVEIVYDNGRLHVETVDSARNPVFFRGHKSERFSLGPGEHFVIGATTFSLVDQRVDVSLDLPHPAEERTFSAEQLRRQPFREPDKRIDALSRLPDIVNGSGSDQELFVRLVNVLLSGIERATAAAIIAADLAAGSFEVLHWDRRILAESEFHPSQRLIRQAVEGGDSVVHVWSDNPSRGPNPFTLSEGTDWALCVPVTGQACAGWSLYVSGSFGGDWTPNERPDAGRLRDDVKFTELAAATVGGLRQSRLLAARQASLNQFFSPVVSEAISNQDADEVLAPREADVTVMFCDLRGFTRESERSAGNLFGLLERVSKALGVMTHHILEHGGVVGDFHGDAVMGFWGWPMPQSDALERACRAALGIRSSFASAPYRDHADAALGRFRVGIGIASGRAVAGKIGTVHQVKVTAFGPVVNLASRLETMTRKLGAAILVDPATASIVRASLPRDVCRVRRMARVQVVGFSSPVEVSELLPPEHDCPEINDAQITHYEAALDAFQSGDWASALSKINAIHAEDYAKNFLTSFMMQHGQTPPPGWDGAIRLAEK